MVITVFRSRLLPENEADFQALADEMMAIAQAMPGFLSYKVYVAADGERASIVEFETAAQLEAWRDHPQHIEAQRIGRERFYSEYKLHVCEPARESLFERPGR